MGTKRLMALISSVNTFTSSELTKSVLLMMIRSAKATWQTQQFVSEDAVSTGGCPHAKRVDTYMHASQFSRGLLHSFVLDTLGFLLCSARSLAYSLDSEALSALSGASRRCCRACLAWHGVMRQWVVLCPKRHPTHHPVALASIMVMMPSC